MIESIVKHEPAGTAMPTSGPLCTSAPMADQNSGQRTWADLRGADRIVMTGVVADVRTFPGTTAWSPPT